MSKFEGKYKALCAIGTVTKKGEPRTIAAGALVTGLSDEDMQSLFDEGRIVEVREQVVLVEVGDETAGGSTVGAGDVVPLGATGGTGAAGATGSAAQ